MEANDIEKAYAKGFTNGLIKGKNIVIGEVRAIIEKWHKFVPYKSLDVFMDEIVKRLNELNKGD